MGSRIKRPLISFEIVEEFLTEELDYDIGRRNYKIVPAITATELGLRHVERFDTSESGSYRHYKYRSDTARDTLRRRIIKELLVKSRPKSDDHIRYGIGGARPLDRKVVPQKKAFILIGLPASGKSGVAADVADRMHALIMDSDFAKRKLPEYKTLSFGASLVHEESSDIVFGNLGIKRGYPSMFEVATALNLNMVIPKVGNNADSIKDFAQFLRDKGYEIHLTLVNLAPAEAARRALSRYKKTKRYVPLSMIVDSFGDAPRLTYLQLFHDRKSGPFKSFGKICNANKLRCEEFTSKNNPAYAYPAKA